MAKILRVGPVGATLRVLLGLIALLSCSAITQAESTQAESAQAEQEEKAKLVWLELGENSATFRAFKSAPASELLNKADYAKYLDLLKTSQCLQAALLLNRAFIKRYPQFAWARLHRYGSSYWIIGYIHYAFPELKHCIAKIEIAASELDAMIYGREMGPFEGMTIGKEPPSPDSYWGQRDLAIRSIIHMVIDDYIPALSTLSYLILRGDVFEIPLEVEYYILKRTCLLGQPCTQFAARIAELEKRLPKDKLTKMRALAGRKQSDKKLLFRIFLEKSLFPVKEKKCE